MAETLSDDTAKRVRRRVERAIRSIRPSTPARKALVSIAVPIAGEMTELAVRALERKGPELVAKGADLAKEKLPVAAQLAKTKVNQLRAGIRERRSRGASGVV